MGGAGIGDRHQRAVEGDDGDVAGGGQHAIAGQTPIAAMIRLIATKAAKIFAPM